MPGNEAFELVSERGWTRGLPAMLSSGLSRWFRTRMWWVHCLIWSLVICGVLALVAFNPDVTADEELIILFGVFAGLFPAIGVIILMQDALVGEKRAGTAAWVLSKPLTRPAFVVSKIIATSLGIVLTMVVVPSILAFSIIALSHKSSIYLPGCIAAMGILFVSHFFFLSLTLMLGAFFSSRGPVIGIPLAVLFLQVFFLQFNLIGFLPALRYILPWSLIVPVGRDTPSLAYALIKGIGSETDVLITLVVILAESLLFILLGIWRFNREEF